MPVHVTGRVWRLLVVVGVPAAANELPNGYAPGAMTAEEANFREWDKSCQEIEATWAVCTNEGDDNHAFIMENCPFTCAQARGEVVYLYVPQT
jgi:hypothetical protein